jgi:rhodanese-related sulfurtransferase
LLKKLTPEQVLLAIQVRDEWLNHVFKSDIPLDKELAIEGVKWLYSLAKMPTPYVVVLDSPRSCQIAANILKKETLFQVEGSGLESGRGSGQGSGLE